MKIEIEISEELIQKYIDNYIKNNLTQSGYSYTMRQLIDRQVKEALVRSFQDSNFSNIIKEKCTETAIREIELAANKKVPGWVAQQMKEMLKYARARFWEKQ